ncbi:transporter [Deferrisoma palaeochoriense]
MNGKRSAVVVVAALLVGGAAGPSRAAGNLSLGIGLDVQTGDYGTGETTDAWSVTVQARYRPAPRWSLEVSVPYLYQSASTTTTTAGGMRFDVESDRRSPATGGSAVMDSRRHGAGNVDTVTEAQEGLGDVAVGVSYSLIEESDAVPEIRVSADVKVPTADERKNLGTGEWDLEVGAEAAKILGDWDLFGSARYVFQGESEAFGLRDFGAIEAGLGRFVTDVAEVWTSVFWASAPSEYAGPSAEVRLGLDVGFPSGFGLGGYVSKGVTDGAPDYGAGVTASVTF